MKVKARLFFFVIYDVGITCGQLGIARSGAANLDGLIRARHLALPRGGAVAPAAKSFPEFRKKNLAQFVTPEERPLVHAQILPPKLCFAHQPDTRSDAWV